MLTKISQFIEKIRLFIFYRKCYHQMDKYNYRTYIKEDICAGLSPYRNNETCKACPYFVDIRDNDDWA